jgi:predicted RNase H-like HicB family nuclease
MTGQYILSDYLDRALAQAEYDKLEDGTFFGRIPACKGVVAFAATLRECEDELRSVLEDWVLVGLKLGHDLPILDGIDLNKPVDDPFEKFIGAFNSGVPDWADNHDKYLGEELAKDLKVGNKK